MPIMHGYAMDKSGTVVNRNVPDLDVEAYKRAGYKLGAQDGAPTAEEYAESKPEAEDESVDLSKLTKAELLEKAEAEGIDVAKSAKKDDILAAIEGAE